MVSPFIDTTPSNKPKLSLSTRIPFTFCGLVEYH